MWSGESKIHWALALPLLEALILSHPSSASPAASCHRMDDSAPLLVQLPDPCLLAVLQCCASDLRSLLSAARAHSRLHQAAVVALSSISVGEITQQQQQVDGLLQYLSSHGQHVQSLDLVPGDAILYMRQLPRNLQLSSLALECMDLQLQPGGGFQGVVRPGVPLKKLQLIRCILLDGVQGLAAALSLLPGLQHLSIQYTANAIISMFPVRVLADFVSGLQKLTCLELAGMGQDGPDDPPALQALQCLTQLADLDLLPAVRQAWT